MQIKSKELWLPIIITIPISILINVLTTLLDVQILLALVILSVLVIVYFIFSDKIRNLLIERNRQSRIAEAKKLQVSLIEAEELASNLTMYISRIALEILVSIFITSAGILIGILLILVGPIVPDFVYKSIFPGIVIGFIITIVYRIRNIKFISQLYRFDEYKNETNARIASLTQTELVVTSARYGFENKEIDITKNLNQLIVSNRLSCKINNDIAGDPAQGVPKRLILEYKLDGKMYNLKLKEGDTLIIP